MTGCVAPEVMQLGFCWSGGGLVVVGAAITICLAARVVVAMARLSVKRFCVSKTPCGTMLSCAAALKHCGPACAAGLTCHSSGALSWLLLFSKLRQVRSRIGQLETVRFQNLLLV